LSGDDPPPLPVMSVGGRGVISVAGNEVPAEMSRICDAVDRGDWAEARTLHTRLMPLLSINFVESNPGPVKYAMAKMGLIEETYRLPMVSPRDESKAKIDRVLSDLGLLSQAAAGAARGRGPRPTRSRSAFSNWPADRSTSAATRRATRSVNCARRSPKGACA